VPGPTADGRATATLKIPARAQQLLVSVAAIFLSIFGAQLVAGAVHVTSLPGITALITSAISAAVVGAVQFAIGLVPTPPAVPATRPSGLRGRLPAKRVDLPFIHLARRRPTTSPLPASADISHGWARWLMLGNGPDKTLTVNGGKPTGDCFFAAVFHGLIAKALVRQADGRWALRPGFRMPTANEVVGLYLGYQSGLAPGQSATTGPDRGTVLADGLAWLRKAGIIGRYGPVDYRDRTAVKTAVIDHKGIIVGVNLDEYAEEEFEEGLPWEELGDPTVGGHAIYQVAYAPDYDTDITWAADQRVSVQWDASQVEEAWWFEAPWEDASAVYELGEFDKKLAAIA
jgi:hypothetical protein